MTKDSSRDTPSRLRQDIDAGRSRDKVAFPDPAAAPLGTDDEAAGTPVSREQARMAHAEEVQQDDEGSAAHPADVHARHTRGIDAGASLDPHARGAKRGRGWMVAVAVLVLVVLILALIMQLGR
jgi:hypothetical protein